MLREYGRNYDSIWVRLSRPLIILVSLALVILVMFGVTLVWNMLSEKQERLQMDLVKEQEALLDDIGILVTEAGYIVLPDPGEQLYVPAVRGFVSNRTQQELDRILLSADFKTDDRYICRSQIPILHLLPGETREIKFRCVEISGFGAIITGMNIMQTTNKIHYSVEIIRETISVQVDSGELMYKLLN